MQRRLRASQGPFVPKPGLPIIDELVATVLSQHTSDLNSERAFAQLKERFPSWEQVADAPEDEVAEAIRAGGIANQKARRIQQILTAIEERRASSTSAGCTSATTRRSKATCGRCPASDQRPRRACWCSRWDGQRSRSTPTCTGWRCGSAGSRRDTPADQAYRQLAPQGSRRYQVRPARRDDHARPYGLPRPAARLRRLRARSTCAPTPMRPPVRSPTGGMSREPSGGS